MASLVWSSQLAQTACPPPCELWMTNQAEPQERAQLAGPALGTQACPRGWGPWGWARASEQGTDVGQCLLQPAPRTHPGREGCQNGQNVPRPPRGKRLTFCQHRLKAVELTAASSQLFQESWQFKWQMILQGSEDRGEESGRIKWVVETLGLLASPRSGWGGGELGGCAPAGPGETHCYGLNWAPLPKRYVAVLTPSICERNLIWK